MASFVMKGRLEEVVYVLHRCREVFGGEILITDLLNLFREFPEIVDELNREAGGSDVIP